MRSHQLTKYQRDNPILSHNPKASELDDAVKEIHNEIIFEGDKPHTTVEEELKILSLLQKTDFGQFLIKNSGLNGYWSDAIIFLPQKTLHNPHHADSDIDEFMNLMVNQLPSVLARRESFAIYHHILQKNLFENIVICSIPCGLMRDLYTLDYSALKNFSLIGLDLDAESLSLASSLSQEYNLTQYCEFHQMDAWKMPYKECFDIVTCHGLTIYEYDDDNVISLYKNIFNSLKVGGKFISSYLTPPPNKHVETEWKLERINTEALRLQKVIFSDILQAKWNAYRSSELTKSQLFQAGFDDVEIHYDQAHILPSFIAYKK